MNIDLDTSEKLVSLIAGGIAIIGTISGFMYYRKKNNNDDDPRTPMPTIDNHSTSTGNSQSLTINVSTTPSSTPASELTAVPVTDLAPVSPPSGPISASQLSSLSVADMKKSAKVIFIDDDRGFKIVGVLKKMGWESTKLITDVSSLEHQPLADAHVVFVDIQGVGRQMQYADEGLGLVLAIKRRYPEKKVIIYSAIAVGERFHDAFNEADSVLSKTAEPIRFEETIVRVLRR